jgi:hypothetical protein
MKFWKLFTKVIKSPSKVGLGLDRQNALIKREAQALLFQHQTGCLKSEAQAHIYEK